MWGGSAPTETGLVGNELLKEMGLTGRAVAHDQQSRVWKEADRRSGCANVCHPCAPPEYLAIGGAIPAPRC